MCVFFFFFFAFQYFVADKNKYSGLGISENIFTAELILKKIICPDKICQTDLRSGDKDQICIMLTFELSFHAIVFCSIFMLL